MASAYPAALDSFTDKQNDQDDVDASHVTDLQNSIVAIQTELGTDPAGTATDLKTRLAVSINDNGTNKKRDLTVTGLGLSNNATDPNNDIDIAAGQCLDLTSGADELMVLSSGLTKRLDASWAAGTGGGMLDGTESVAGTADGATWYHLWLIKNPTTGAVDVLASESATAPTMPAGYTIKRRIGSIRTGSGTPNIAQFTQRGDNFTLDDINATIDTTNPGASAVTVTLFTPSGIVTEAVINASLTDNSPAAQTYLLLTALDQTDATPGVANASLTTNVAGATVPQRTAGQFRVFTNTSSQIRYRLDASTTDTIVRINTVGWVDRRGQDAA